LLLHVKLSSHNDPEVNSMAVLPLNVDLHKLVSSSAGVIRRNGAGVVGKLIVDFGASYRVRRIHVDLKNAAERCVVGLNLCVVDINNLKGV